MIALNGTSTTFHPFLTGPGIALEAGLVAKENVAGGIGQKIQQLVGEVFALDLPGFPVGRFRHAAGDLPRVVVLVEIAVEGTVSHIELLLLAEVSTEFGQGPMGLTGQGRIVHKGKDELGDDVGFELPAPAAPGAVDEAVDSQIVETGDPETKGAFAHPAVAQGNFVGRTDQKEVDGVEAAVGFAVRTAIQRLLQLLKAAGVRVR
jgi:hypothetical protein